MKENHVSAMKADIIGHSYKSSGKIRGSGGTRIPAVDKFIIENSEINELLRDVGIKKKLRRKVIVERSKYYRMNRYIEHQLIRIEKNPKLFGTIAEACVRRSVSFRMSSITKVFPRGGINMPIKKVIYLVKNISVLINKDSDDLVYKRVYIPKNDTFRPLGVPSGEGRVIMNMWNNWLTLYLKEEVSTFNHAYIPGRGSLTAWKDIIKNKGAKYIYEFDLKNFFGEVDINKVTEMLFDRNVKKSRGYWLENINLAVPVLGEDKIDESRLRNRYNVRTILKSGQELKPEMVLSQESIDGITMPLLESFMIEDGYSNMHEYLQAQGAMFDHYKPAGFGTLYKGLPQGLNTSPILSILTLKDGVEENKKRGINLIMYADDGIMYSDHDFTPFWMDGVIPNMDKSGGVKREGRGLKELKFLGIVYNGEKNLIKGSTRNGSNLEFSSETIKVFDLLKSLLTKGYEMCNMELLTSSNIFGLISAKLYAGSGGEILSHFKGGNEVENSVFNICKSKLVSKDLEPTRLSSSMFIGILASIVKENINRKR